MNEASSFSAISRREIPPGTNHKKRGAPIGSRTRLLPCILALLMALSGCASADAPTQIPDSAPATIDATPAAPEVTGSNGAVSSASPLASAIGLDVLRAGGNAVDAAVAVSFALGLVEPNASGLGGCGYMLYVPSGSEPVFWDYRSTAPAKLDCEAFMELSAIERKDTILGAGVPGAVAGWLTALEEYGTMSLSDLLAPTIALADEGFPVSQHFEGMIVDNYTKLAQDEVCSELYLDEGLPYEVGSLVKNPDYADTLRIIADKGRDGFYTGEVARSIIDAVEAKGGVMTMEDLAGYTVKRENPVKSRYRGYSILSSGPSSSGGTAIALGLNILERYDLKAMGQNSPQALHLMTEAFKLINVDRYEYLGDGDFIDIPIDILISNEYADRRAALIAEDSVMADVKPEIIPYESPSTTHFSIADSEGNIISVTNTLGTFFGCGTGVPGRGFLLDNQMNDFSVEDWEVNFPQPGKRPRSSMSPTVIFNPDGTPYASLGTPGGEAIVTTMIQVISNMLDYNMDIQEAIDAPRIYQNYSGKLSVEGHLNEDVITALEQLGHSVEKKAANSSFFGGVHAIVRGGDGSWTGGADPRRDGQALAY